MNTRLVTYLQFWKILRSSHLGCSIKQDFLENFAKFRRKHLRWSHYDWSPATLIERNFSTGDFFTEDLWATVSVKKYFARVYQGVMFVFQKIWCTLFFCNTRYQIPPVALIPTSLRSTQHFLNKRNIETCDDESENFLAILLRMCIVIQDALGRNYSL